MISIKTSGQFSPNYSDRTFFQMINKTIVSFKGKNYLHNDTSELALFQFHVIKEIKPELHLPRILIAFKYSSLQNNKKKQWITARPI